MIVLKLKELIKNGNDRIMIIKIYSNKQLSHIEVKRIYKWKMKVSKVIMNHKITQIKKGKDHVQEQLINLRMM